jgi:carboxyl-terminal processing protease
MNPTSSSSKKTWVLIVVSLVLLGATFGLGYKFGAEQQPAILSIPELSNKEVGKPEQTDFSLFWQAWNTLSAKYVGSSTPTDKEKMYSAIEGLAASYGDPYTTFFPPVESKQFSETVSGTFAGVGMEVGIRDGILVVIAPLKNTPAYRAGIKAGDAILKIDDTDATVLTVDKAVSLIRGEKGTKVKLTMGRKDVDQPIVFEVIRDNIEIPTVDTEHRKDGVFVIHLYNFSAVSPGLFREGLREFVESGSDKLILDLRGNPGGYLEAAVDVASWFLAPGEIIVTEDFGKAQSPEVYRSKGYNIFTDKLKLAVLINGGSASASEILAGALHDHEKAVLVGEKSFGKGSVQELIDLPEDTSLKVTIARWLTPSGGTINHNGIEPDVIATTTEANFKKGIDDQLEKAAEVLLQMSKNGKILN